MRNSQYVWPLVLSTTLGAAGTLLAMSDDVERTDLSVGGALAGGDPDCPSRPLSSEQFEVTTMANGAKAVSAGDLNGDLDPDIVSASAFDDTIAWFESDGGDPPSFVRHEITNSADGAQSVFVVDVEGDGDLDILFANSFGDELGWFENDGSDPPVFTEHLLDGAANGAASVYGADLDDDDDIDIVTGSSVDDTVRWWENDGNDPPVFTEHLISGSANNVASVFVFDIDNDTNLDVVAAFGPTVEWYESDGGNPPTFTARNVTSAMAFAQSVNAADLDNDLDGDIMTASLTDHTVAWYENDGADPPVFTQRILSTTAGRPTSVFASDLDDDTFVDILVASSNNDTITWFQNQGDGTFLEFIITTHADGAQDVIAFDIDDDLQVDAISASFNDDTVAWYDLQQPELGVCCLSDGTCEETTCLADCAAVLGWRWEGGVTCADAFDCPGDTAPALFLVEELSLDNFRQNIVDLAAFQTRYWDRDENQQAILLIKDRLESYGYDNVTLDSYMFQNVEKFNVYATKIGKTRPTEMYILGAHMDSININGNQDNAPGADDDGSGSSSVLELARVFATVDTDISIRFALWNNEETGLNGSTAYVANHKDLQGTMEEPTWLGMIQQDMILYDRFVKRDVDVEYQTSEQNEGHSVIFAAFVAGAMERYGTGEFPAQVSGNMRNTDSVPFMTETTAISGRENTRDEIGNGSNPHWHQTSDVPDTYTDEDYRQGYNQCRMIAGAIGELVNARPAACPEDLDGSGAVDFGDILDILAAWGNAGGPEDLDESGFVDFGDILAVLGAWGPCP